MKLVVDSKIPFVRGVAEQLGEVAYIDGAAIGPADVKQADALVVRTRTLCNRELLEGSRVQFIATATIGFDHLDAAWLAQAGIGWTNCPGCNARSVAQYVEASLLQLAVHGCWSGGPLRAATAPASGFDPAVFAGLTLGIVGVGHVGQAVEAMARRLGFGEILRCDPPRAEREGSEGFLPVEEVARRADVLTFHTPLTHAPEPHPTFHLADAALLARLKPRPCSSTRAGAKWSPPGPCARPSGPAGSAPRSSTPGRTSPASTPRSSASPISPRPT